MRRGPGFYEIELPFAAAAHQVVAARLQQQFARRAEADAGVRTVQFFFDDQVQAGQAAVRHVVMAFVAVLQARAFQMRRAWVTEQVQRLRVGAEILRHGVFSKAVEKPTTQSGRERKASGLCASWNRAWTRDMRSRRRRRAARGAQADRDYQGGSRRRLGVVTDGRHGCTQGG
ncbi:hypothetical protein D3C78_1453120 [compost metagenome]